MYIVSQLYWHRKNAVHGDNERPTFSHLQIAYLMKSKSVMVIALLSLSSSLLFG